MSKRFVCIYHWWDLTAFRKDRICRGWSRLLSVECSYDSNFSA